MSSLFRLIAAISLLPPFFIVGYSYHLYKEVVDKHSFSMNEYNDTVAYQIDKTGCAMVYNIKDHTLSAMCVEKGHWWFMYLINLLFWDKNHCQDQWKKEFNIKANNDN